MNKLIVVLSFFGILSSAHAQSMLEEIPINKEAELKTEGNFTLKIEKSEKSVVRLDSVLAKKYRVVTKGSKVRIIPKRDERPKISDTIILRCMQLPKLSCDGKTVVFSSDTLEQQKLKIKAEGGSEVTLAIKAEEVDLLISTNSGVQLTGYTREQKVEIIAGGHYLAEHLESVSADIKVNAGGEADVQAQKFIKAHTNLGGIIRIHGKTQEIDSKQVLGGKVLEIE